MPKLLYFQGSAKLKMMKENQVGIDNVKTIAYKMKMNECENI